MTLPHLVASVPSLQVSLPTTLILHSQDPLVYFMIHQLKGSYQTAEPYKELTPRLCFSKLEKEMATHSSVLAWRIPGTEKPGRLQSTGSHRVEHN